MPFGDGDADPGFDFAYRDYRWSGQRRCRGTVVRTGRCDEFCCVNTIFVTRIDPPPITALLTRSSCPISCRMHGALGPY